jgi:hypothetical protein
VGDLRLDVFTISVTDIVIVSGFMKHGYDIPLSSITEAYAQVSASGLHI